MQQELLLSVDTSTYVKLDPRTKLLLLLLINAVLLGSTSTYFIELTTAAIPLFLLIVSKKAKASVFYAGVYAMATLADAFLIPSTQGIVNIVIVMMSGIIYRMVPGLVMGYYLISTTKVSEFVAAMEKMHVTQKIVIPFSVMFRFFPTVMEEAGSINDAMRMRGVGFGTGVFMKNPMALLEYRMVPLLMSAVKIGEELSAASLTRGLGSPEKRTNICKIGFDVWDISLLIIGAFVFVCFIIL